MLEGYIPGQLLFVHNITIPIKHNVDWESIRQQKHMKINKEYICEINKQVDHDYKVGYKVMLTNNAAYK